LAALFRRVVSGVQRREVRFRPRWLEFTDVAVVGIANVIAALRR
jgi:hypothetical protein